jgi:hypothetical protein
MAQILAAEFKQMKKTNPKVHNYVKSTYASFEIDGQQYFQIDMYG